MLFAAILANPNPVLVKPALVAWLVAATTHLAFHVGHLQGFSAADGTAQTMGLALSVLLSAVVLWVLHREEADDHGPHSRAAGSAPARMPRR